MINILRGLQHTAAHDSPLIPQTEDVNLNPAAVHYDQSVMSPNERGLENNLDQRQGPSSLWVMVHFCSVINIVWCQRAD